MLWITAPLKTGKQALVQRESYDNVISGLNMKINSSACKLVFPLFSKKELRTPPDVQATVRKFIPSNGRLSRVIIKSCDEVYRSRFLPMQLVKSMVDRALEEIRRGGDEIIETRMFHEKMVDYAKSLKPRFHTQITEMNRRGGRL